MFWDRENRPMETLDWARAFEDAAYRIVALDFDEEHLMVSTIWEGMHSPAGLHVTGETAMIFETAKIRDGKVVTKHRWHTEAEALAGHRWMCLDVLGREPQPEDQYRELVITREQEGEAHEAQHGRESL